MKRWIAYKLDIYDIVNSEHVENNSVKVWNKKIKRVKLMASVVSKMISDEDTYGFLVVDDGTETLRVRCFENNLDLIKSVEIGDIADIIGRIREYEGEIYVIPESILKIENPNLLILRKLELLKQKKEMSGVDSVLEVTEERIESEEISGGNIPENPREKIMKLIKELDLGEGVDISTIKERFNDEEKVESLLKELSNEGEIFEPRPEKIKLLE